jgi:hypothetical protein
LESQVNAGGKDASKVQDIKTAKQVRILENRLDHALVRFNEALAVNKKLREEIDHLRRERVVFDNINNKLGKELHEKKKEMALIIEQSNIAYEARDQAHSEMALLKAQADKEQSVFEVEWRELGKILERDRRLKGTMAGDKSAPREGEAGKANKSNWDAAKDKASNKTQLDRVQSFEEAFQQIKAATGIDNIDELVQTFIDAEDQNFSLFNYVSELNNEMEKLEEHISDIKADMDKYKGQGGQNDRQVCARHDSMMPLTQQQPRVLAAAMRLPLPRACTLGGDTRRQARPAHARDKRKWWRGGQRWMFQE